MPNVLRITKISCVITLVNTSAERSFSALKMVKTSLKSNSRDEDANYLVITKASSNETACPNLIKSCNKFAEGTKHMRKNRKSSLRLLLRVI